MTLTPGERYSIVFRDGNDERAAVAHYRGYGTGDAIARGEESVATAGGATELHWFKIDGEAGYRSIDEDDLVAYEAAEGHGG